MLGRSMRGRHAGVRLLSSSVVVTASGPNRVGRVAGVSQAVFQAGGSIAESTSIELHGTFSMSLLVNLPDGDAGKLSSSISAAMPEMHVAVHETAPVVEPAFMAMVTIDTDDQAGIMAKLAESLAAVSLNVARMETACVWAGDEVQAQGTVSRKKFKLKGMITSQEVVDVAKLRADLKNIEGDMGLQIGFEAVSAEKHKSSWGALRGE